MGRQFGLLALGGVLCALAACNSVPTNGEVITAVAPVPATPGEGACLTAVAQRTGVEGATVLRTDTAETGSVIHVSVPGAGAPWTCRVAADGTVVEVSESLL